MSAAEHVCILSLTKKNHHSYTTVFSLEFSVQDIFFTCVFKSEPLDMFNSDVTAFSK